MKILENIFTYLSTTELLLKVNRINSKFSQTAVRFVRRKRKIALHDEKTILGYCDMIKSGGHQYPNLCMLLEISDWVWTDNNAEKVISGLSRFGGNVQDLYLLCNLWDSNTPISSA